MSSTKSLVQSGTSIPNIQIFIRAKYSVNISYDVIFNIKNNFIDELIGACSKYPAGASIDRLIGFFNSSSNVSYMYI